MDAAALAGLPLARAAAPSGASAAPTMIREDFRLYDEYRLFRSGERDWAVEELGSDPALRREIGAFLATCDLALDAQVAEFVTVRSGGRLVACAGMDGGIVKCVAVSPALRGENITARLITEVTNLAAERGQYHLFLYTKPENAPLFAACGFYPLVELPGRVVLMENTPSGLSRYCADLAATRRPGGRIGSIVMNANPFTYGHQYLATRAEADCDWLHVFVVGENSSLVTYEDRFALVREGLKDFPRTTLHPGSAYMISKATFPSYFLKDRGIVDACHTAIDLRIFREHVAPALGVTHRYVGTEPFCPVTRKYNADMTRWLVQEPSVRPPVTVVEIERKALGGLAISASEVRRRLRGDDFEGMAALAPKATVELLRAKYFDPAARRATGTG
jgi:[citrate (pro-3S)-lyase] ligase